MTLLNYSYPTPGTTWNSARSLSCGAIGRDIKFITGYVSTPRLAPKKPLGNLSPPHLSRELEPPEVLENDRRTSSLQYTHHGLPRDPCGPNSLKALLCSLLFLSFGTCRPGNIRRIRATRQPMQPQCRYFTNHDFYRQ